MTRGKYKKWSAEEDLVISRMRAEGKSIREIAKALNRSFSSVQGRVRILLGECKLQKIVITGYSRSVKPKTTSTKKTKKSKIDAQKVLQYVSETPWNISSAFKRYSEESGISVKAIHNAYYCKSSYRTRIKDMGPALSIVGANGHTTNNGKNTNTLYKSSNLWQKIKRWIWQYFS
jgi:IS30 family transposase